MATDPDPYSTLHAFLDGVSDPRAARGRRHALPDVLFIALVAVIAGAEDAEAIEDFGSFHEAWFRERCGLAHGVPSQDTFLRVLAALCPAEFGCAFATWVEDLWERTAGAHIAIDGKTLRRSFDRAFGASPVHSVAAFVSDTGLVLGQVAVAESENEIVAIPKLLQLVDVEGATVTIDAIGCQIAIADAIHEAGGDYVLQVKGNQPTLRDQVTAFFHDAERESRPFDDPAPELDSATSVDALHGRIEERVCTIANDTSWLDGRDDWPGLAGIARVERTCTNKQTGRTSNEASYFIYSAADACASDILDVVRRHWTIENQLHWVLDVSFDEDQCRIRSGHAAENLATIRRAALNLLRDAPNPARHRKKADMSIKRRRVECERDPEYRARVLRLS